MTTSFSTPALSSSLLMVNVLNYVAEVLCPVDPGIFSLAGHRGNFRR